MTVTTVTFDGDRAAPPLPASTPQLRLSLTPHGSAPGRLDGAWWPHSRNLLLELPALVAELDSTWGRVTRITVNPHRWPVVPRRIPVGGHVIHVGWFLEEQDQHEMMIRSFSPGRLDLLVIPPETDDGEAARLMDAAADPANTRTASELISDGPRATAVMVNGGGS
ncbi:DUF5994 family protein [Kitasatospora sp. NPDC050543]|uniref:DUF5994 family protein n=1 Tax=Kitasatospora sp. NPDC050543 TaxID=3364054 RepID=UPI0037B9DA3C